MKLVCCGKERLTINTGNSCEKVQITAIFCIYCNTFSYHSLSNIYIYLFLVLDFGNKFYQLKNIFVVNSSNWSCFQIKLIENVRKLGLF